MPRVRSTGGCQGRSKSETQSNVVLVLADLETIWIAASGSTAEGSRQRREVGAIGLQLLLVCLAVPGSLHERGVPRLRLCGAETRSDPGGLPAQATRWLAQPVLDATIRICSKEEFVTRETERRSVPLLESGALRTCQKRRRVIAAFSLVCVGAEHETSAVVLCDGVQGSGKEMKLDNAVAASSRRAARALTRERLKFGRRGRTTQSADAEPRIKEFFASPVALFCPAQCEALLWAVCCLFKVGDRLTNEDALRRVSGEARLTIGAGLCTGRQGGPSACPCSAGRTPPSPFSMLPDFHASESWGHTET
ncbi:hypothetical protein B0I37DRAFT_106620 [Chaetomium sp. MPI-CAGE-AT-0009]|nr:hypothetical protein B0I37DRAFT_106620 [Chaetomium sp. MPI-CAGE-AT-0009]